MPDITHPRSAPIPAPPSHTPETPQHARLVTKDPFATPCTCGKSYVVLTMPWFHCPNCHDSYRLHKLSPPSRCAHCNFNVLMWMRRNNLTFNAPPFP